MAACMVSCARSLVSSGAGQAREGVVRPVLAVGLQQRKLACERRVVDESDAAARTQRISASARSSTVMPSHAPANGFSKKPPRPAGRRPHRARAGAAPPSWTPPARRRVAVPLRKRRRIAYNELMQPAALHHPQKRFPEALVQPSHAARQRRRVSDAGAPNRLVVHEKVGSAHRLAGDGMARRPQRAVPPAAVAVETQQLLVALLPRAERREELAVVGRRRPESGRAPVSARRLGVPARL